MVDLGHIFHGMEQRGFKENRMPHLLQDLFEHYPSLNEADQNALTEAAKNKDRSVLISFLDNWAGNHSNQETREQALKAVELLSK